MIHFKGKFHQESYVGHSCRGIKFGHFNSAANTQLSLQKKWSQNDYCHTMVKTIRHKNIFLYCQTRNKLFASICLWGPVPILLILSLTCMCHCHVFFFFYIIILQCKYHKSASEPRFIDD